MPSLNYAESLPPESEFIEYKSSFNKLSKDIWETISAFENTSGGCLILGVKEKDSKTGNTINEPKGVKDPQKILEQFWSNVDTVISFNTITNSDVKQIPLDNGRTIIEINVKEAKDIKKPVTASKLPYIRKGPVDLVAKGEDYKNLVSNSSNELDTQVLSNYWIDDLDLDSVYEYKRLLTSREQYKSYADLENEDFLTKIGVIAKDYDNDGAKGITSGGLLFFGKNNAIIHEFPNFQLEYYDQTSTTDRWDNRVSSVISNLNIFSFYQSASAAINMTIANEFKLDDKSNIRKDTSKAMRIALREALLNMLMHANYYEDGVIEAHAHFNYYEFINPGKMKIPVEDFFTTNKTSVRNPIISKLFVQLGSSERAGHGGEKIFESALVNNFRNPEITSNELKTNLRIWKVDYASSFSGKEITERERIVLRAIVSSENHSMSHKEIEQYTKLSRTKVTVTLDKLIEKNILIKVGKSRATKYQIPTTSTQLLAQMEALPQLYRKTLKGFND